MDKGLGYDILVIIELGFQDFCGEVPFKTINLGRLICSPMSLAQKLSECDYVDLHRKPFDEALYRVASGRPTGRLRAFRSSVSSVEIQPKQQSSSLQSQPKSSAWRSYQQSNRVSTVSTSESLLCHQ